MQKIAPLVLTTLALALVSIGSPASAAPACTAPPPVPYGYILGKVDNVDASGNARISYANPKAMRMYRGADLYQVTCDGALVKAGHGAVKSFDERTATLQASFADRGFKAEGVVGQYVVIDAGGDSAAPAGLAQVDITNIDVVDGDSRVTLGVGEEDGVFPESTGVIVLRGGRRVNFKILTTTRRASTIKIRVSLDETRAAERVLVTLRTPRCFGPEPIANASSVQGTAPANYVFADAVKDVSKVPTFTVLSPVRAAKGGSAYIFGNNGQPLGLATVESSNGKEVTLRLSSFPLVGMLAGPALSKARVLVPKTVNPHCAE